jgi:hypothetical protein
MYDGFTIKLCPNLVNALGMHFKTVSTKISLKTVENYMYFKIQMVECLNFFSCVRKKYIYIYI